MMDAQQLSKPAAALFDLHGKVALVTGGSRGLGYEIVKAFAEAGADVIVASRKLDACERVAAEVRQLQRRALAIRCHVGEWDDVGRLVDSAYEHFGRVDILVNNAGMSPLAPSSVQTSEALFDKIVSVNMKGPFRLTALVATRMVQADGGVVINISSTGALRPKPHFAPYAGAKAALNAFTMAFAQEYAPKVRVNTLCAGPFLTDVALAWPKDKREGSDNVLGRPGQPHELVTAALYLASPYSTFTTGALLQVDGGIL